MLTPERVRILVELGAAALCLAIAFGTGWHISGLRGAAEIARLKADAASARATQAEDALSTLQADAALIHTAATVYAGVQDTLSPKIDALRKDLKNAPAPLAPGCAPDAYRVRNLEAAIDAANAAGARH